MYKSLLILLLSAFLLGSANAQEAIVVDSTFGSTSAVSVCVEPGLVPFTESAFSIVAKFNVDPVADDFGFAVEVVAVTCGDDPEPPYTLPDPAPENPTNPVKPVRTPEEEKQAQKEYEEYKELEKVPDAEKNETDNCKKLKMELERKRKLITARQAWDDKWFPGRHAGDIYRLKKNYNKVYEEWKKACGNKGCGCQSSVLPENESALPENESALPENEIPNEAFSVLEPTVEDNK